MLTQPRIFSRCEYTSFYTWKVVTNQIHKPEMHKDKVNFLLLKQFLFKYFFLQFSQIVLTNKMN